MTFKEFKDKPTKDIMAVKKTESHTKDIYIFAGRNKEIVVTPASADIRDDAELIIIHKEEEWNNQK